MTSSRCFGKKAQVWKSTNFDAGLYDITGFLWALIISIHHMKIFCGLRKNSNLSSAKSIHHHLLSRIIYDISSPQMGLLCRSGITCHMGVKSRLAIFCNISPKCRTQ